MEKVFSRPESLSEKQFTYCPGCGHSIIHRLTAEVIDELGIRTKTIGVASVGCSVFADEFFGFDFVQAAHGRAPAVAVGVKRVRPECVVFTHQGDGDLASIGTAETIHSANRGEKITVVFVNNAIYGMTGGQMAPTTMPGQKTTTTPKGRSIVNEGFPLRVSEMLATLEQPAYIERCVIGTPRDVIRTKNAIKKSFRVQRDLKAFSLVEILSPCPTYWRVSPPKAERYIVEYFEKVFPRGVIKDKTK